MLVYASVGISVTGVTADAVTGQAEATGGSGTVDGGMSVVGATASVTGNAGEATVTMTGGPISITGVTAIVTAAAGTGNGVVATSVVGDSYTAPTIIGWSDGSVTWSTGNYTTEAGEPASTGTYYRSRYFAYYGNRLPVTFVATAATAVRLDVWDSSSAYTDPNNWSEIDMQSGTTATVTDIFAGPTQPTIVRVAATTDTSYSVTLQWTVTDVPANDSPSGSGALLQIIDPEVEYCPSSVTFSMYDGPVEGTVSLKISPDPLGWGTIETYTTEETGTILGESLPLDGDLPAGTYTVTATYAGGTATDSFQVLEAPVSFPAADATDLAPTNTPVTRWQLHDRAGVLSDFEFTYNPDRMTSPWALRSYVNEATTSPDGQPIIWESFTRAVDWEFSGYIDSETDIAAIQAYVDLNRRFYLIDHRQRTWVVAFKGWDLQPKRVWQTPYAHTYTIRALIYRQVV